MRTDTPDIPSPAMIKAPAHSPTVTVRVEHACWLNGEAYPIGAEVEIPALAAYDVLASHRCVLVDPAQRKDVDAAVRKHGAEFAQQRQQHWSMAAETTGNRWRINPLAPRV